MKKSFYLLAFGTIFLCGFQSSKYIVGFKEIKKNIDTLVLIEPNVFVKTSDFYGKEYYDSSLNDKVKSEIANKTLKILKNKYIMQYDSVLFDNDSLIDEDLDKLITTLKSLNNPIQDIKIPSSFQDLLSFNDKRYYLLIFLRAQYIDGKPTRQDVLYLDPLFYTYMKQYVFICDNFEKRILYYNDSFSKDEANNTELVERITSRTLQTIYYK
jgi:hypothetical protein